MILDEIKEAYVRDLIQKNKRIDGRGLNDYRKITIQKNVLPNAEGSALAYLGDTKVLAGVKFDVMEPFADRPDEGVVMVGSEFSPIAHPEFQAGPPDERSIELARVVDRGIRSAGVVDVASLAQSDGKVLGVFIDLYVLDHSGNLIDAAALAAMAALTTTRVPQYEAEKIVKTDGDKPLKLSNVVITTSIEKIAGKMVLDASIEEEIASDGRLTIATAEPDLMCAAQKSGLDGFTQQELDSAFELALQKRKELKQFI